MTLALLLRILMLRELGLLVGIQGQLLTPRTEFGDAAGELLDPPSQAPRAWAVLEGGDPEPKGPVQPPA